MLTLAVAVAGITTPSPKAGAAHVNNTIKVSVSDVTARFRESLLASEWSIQMITPRCGPRNTAAHTHAGKQAGTHFDEMLSRGSTGFSSAFAAASVPAPGLRGGRRRWGRDRRGDHRLPNLDLRRWRSGRNGTGDAGWRARPRHTDP